MTQKFSDKLSCSSKFWTFGSLQWAFFPNLVALAPLSALLYPISVLSVRNKATELQSDFDKHIANSKLPLVCFSTAFLRFFFGFLNLDFCFSAVASNLSMTGPIENFNSIQKQINFLSYDRVAHSPKTQG